MCYKVLPVLGTLLLKGPKYRRAQVNKNNFTSTFIGGKNLKTKLRENHSSNTTILKFIFIFFQINNRMYKKAID